MTNSDQLNRSKLFNSVAFIFCGAVRYDRNKTPVETQPAGSIGAHSTVKLVWALPLPGSETGLRTETSERIYSRTGTSRVGRVSPEVWRQAGIGSPACFGVRTRCFELVGVA
ncbi:hypothetical protein DPEC_G00357650 [Dallia pectoralis]|uniref:Uncharacterized protein n=1 Tax=Dallia pectoralis TaxID=75939 RepID=A0ACC2F024_DALPE|nr:hypothetical protein DPEC_G00357650 [Dallia pectoralis]